MSQEFQLPSNLRDTTSIKLVGLTNLDKVSAVKDLMEDGWLYSKYLIETRSTYQKFRRRY